MIEFSRVQLKQKEEYQSILFADDGQSCEYSFANKYLWGRQEMAFLHGCVAFFSHFNGKSVYPYPVGPGDRKAVLEAVMQDARERGIPCRIACMTPAEARELEQWFPGAFLIRVDRDGFDYVYAIDDLADLRGRKYQKKRNHFNRFQAEHPNYEIQPISPDNMAQAQQMVRDWYQVRTQEDPHGDYMLESIAMKRAFQHYRKLGMEGIALLDGGDMLAVTMGSRLSADTFDIHFEKAREDVDGAYAAINCEFARYLRLKYPDIQYLDREDDVGVEGLRKAKLSYNPHHMVEKQWAYLAEDIHGD